MYENSLECRLRKEIATGTNAAIGARPNTSISWRPPDTCSGPSSSIIGLPVTFALLHFEAAGDSIDPTSFLAYHILFTYLLAIPISVTLSKISWGYETSDPWSFEYDIFGLSEQASK